MEIRLAQTLPKVTADSERSVCQAETIERATAAIRRLGIDPQLEVWNRDGAVWVSWLTGDFTAPLPSLARGMRVAGKGPSREQCVASCLMELVERASLYRYCATHGDAHECVELTTGRSLKIGRFANLNDTVCVAAGNNYEEAVLHAMHELVETRLGRSCLWKPFKVVDFDDLEIDLPGWIRDSYVALRTPSDIEELFHVTVIRYPGDGEFDLRIKERLVQAGGWLVPAGGGRPLNHHTPHSGGAAGLNPTACVLRGIGEILQGDRSIFEGVTRRALDGPIQVCAPEELRNHETDSVTGDIAKLLELLGEEVFFGVIDVTDPDLGIPVIKLVSDWDPHGSLVSRRNIALFFEEEGR